MSKTWNWKNFGPKITPSDKRDRESMVTKGHKLVEKSFNELGLGIKKILGLKKFWVRKNFGSKNFVGPKKFESEKYFGPPLPTA